jgi:glycosyltransferase involved in cell wall biosynthesis
MMRIVALLAARNEDFYLERCLEHLFQQGIETCVIDNGSTDRTRQIAKRFLARGVFRIEDLQYPGFFDLVGQLRHKERLAAEIEADWFIHHDADEIREAPRPFATLREGVEAADTAGYSAIDFDEFVFVPTSLHERFENRDYVAAMRYYYFYKPCELHRVNVWKRIGNRIDLADSGGHQVQFNGQRIYPHKFILRHYIALSEDHARRKYGHERIYSQAEVDTRGWHGWRARFDEHTICLPDRSKLKCVDDLPRWDRSEPQAHHMFIAPRQPSVPQSTAKHA